MYTIKRIISKCILLYLRMFPTKSMIDALYVQYINFPHGIENNKETQPPHTHLWDTLTVDAMNFSNIQKKAYISKMPEEHLKALIKTPERVSYHIHGAENLSSSEHMKYYSSLSQQTIKSKAYILGFTGLALISTGAYIISNTL
jgi:hypothetical protein